MNWQKWVLIGWFALGALVAIVKFDKPFPEKTARTLAIGMLVDVALVILVVSA